MIHSSPLALTGFLGLLMRLFPFIFDLVKLFMLDSVMMNTVRTGQIKGKSTELAGLCPLYSAIPPCILLLIPKHNWALLALLEDLLQWKIWLLSITIKIIH